MKISTVSTFKKAETIRRNTIIRYMKLQCTTGFDEWTIAPPTCQSKLTLMRILFGQSFISIYNLYGSHVECESQLLVFLHFWPQALHGGHRYCFTQLLSLFHFYRLVCNIFIDISMSNIDFLHYVDLNKI